MSSCCGGDSNSKLAATTTMDDGSPKQHDNEAEVSGAIGKAERRGGTVQHEQPSTASATTSTSKATSSKIVVPLTLSSLAHVMCLPPQTTNSGGSGEDDDGNDDDHHRHPTLDSSTGGVLEGLLSVVHHTLSELSSHFVVVSDGGASHDARATLQATPWVLRKEKENNEAKDESSTSPVLTDLPYGYSKHSYFHVGINDENPSSLAVALPADPNQWATTSSGDDKSDNQDKVMLLGRVSLYYRSSQNDVTSDDDEDMQQALLTKAIVEYRCSQPSKGSVQARQNEQASLTSFGNGSVDDNVKLGALSSLYDDVGKYVLNITSVRNNSYLYNVQDHQHNDHDQHATASASTSNNGMAQVTVTTHDAPRSSSTSSEMPPLTRLELTLQTDSLSSGGGGGDDGDAVIMLRPLAFPSTQLERHFLVWDESNESNATTARALPSQQTLLLDKRGMYVNGRLLQDNAATSLLPPLLFGCNLDGIPCWHGRVQDYEALKHAYATLWQEIMIDARLARLNIASLLLCRLMNGLDDDDDDEDDNGGDSTNVECLESQLMASAEYDPVGICAKALATRFAQEFGPHAVPCLAHQVEWYKQRMGHKVPVVVPQRVIDVLRRGGYFDLQRDTNEVWFADNVRPAREGYESQVVEEALQLLNEAGCRQDDAPKIMFVKVDAAADPVKNKYMCRYNDVLVQYHVNEAVWGVDKPAVAIAMYVAQEFPDGNVLLKLVSNLSSSSQQTK